PTHRLAYPVHLLPHAVHSFTYAFADLLAAFTHPLFGFAEPPGAVTVAGPGAIRPAVMTPGTRCHHPREADRRQQRGHRIVLQRAAQICAVFSAVTAQLRPELVEELGGRQTVLELLERCQ